MKSWYSRRTLDSGLNVLTAQTASPSATCVFMVKTGSKNEKPDQAGISHFLEHFVFKGTKKFPRTRDVMRALDSVGAEHNAATGKEYTYYWVKAASGHLGRAIELLGEIVFRSALPAKLMNKEKGTILQELAMYEDLPMAKVEDLFEGLMFGKKTPLGRSIIGSRKTISKITRLQLTDYRLRQYRADNCVFAVAGGIKENDVLRYVGKYFDRLPADDYNDYKSYKSYNQSPKRRLVLSKPTDQAHLIMGVPALKRNDSKRYSLGVLATILGGNASSQLFEEIREKRGLAYYVKAGVSLYEEAGTLAIHAGVPPQKASEVYKIVQNQVKNFKFSQREFLEAKEYIKGQLALSWEESEHIAGHLAEDFLFDKKIRSFENLTREVTKVKTEEVEELGRELFSEEIYLAGIGPNLK